MGCLKTLFLIILSPIWIPIWILSKIPLSAYKFLGLALFYLIFWPFLLLFWLFRKAYTEAKPIYAYFAIALVFIAIIMVFVARNNRQASQTATQSAAQTQAQIRFETESALSTERANATATATLWTPTNTLTPSITPTPSNSPRPRDTAIPTATLQLIQTEDGLIFVPVAVWVMNRVDNLRPDNDVFVVIAGELVNRTRNSECLYGRDLALVLDEREYSPDDSLMAAVQDNINPRRDYLGNGMGQCVNRSDQEGTYVAFDVPDNADTVSLSINENTYPLAIDWSSFASRSRTDFVQLDELAVTVTAIAFDNETESAFRQETQEAQSTLDTDATATATLWTPTNTPIASYTPTASDTPRATSTRVPTLTRQPTRLPEGTTYYASQGGNIRPCAEADDTQCPPIGRLARGDDIEVTDNNVTGGDVGGNTRWYQVNYRGQTGYVHSSLLQRTPPVIATAVPVTNSGSGGNGGGNTVQATNPPISQPQWNCSAGDMYDCSDLTCSEIRSYMSACPGDPSNLDGNGDGQACESKCGG